MLTHHEMVGLAECVPHLGDLPSERVPEKGVQFRRGDKIAATARFPHRLPVVPQLGVIEREIHESGKGDRPVLVDDARDLQM